MTPNPALTPASASSRRVALTVGLLWLYCVCRGLLLAGIVPPWQGPDEPSHVEYALLLARQRALPLQPDAALEAQILASMAAQRFYSHVNAPPPTAVPALFAEVERLRDAPTQIGSETPLGYLPFAVAASLAGGIPKAGESWGTQAAGHDSLADPGAADRGAAITRQLRAMRLAAVGLVLIAIGLAALAAVDMLGAALAPAAVVLVAAMPMLGFAGAAVNNDLTAVVLATLWFTVLARGARRGLSWPWLTALVLIAALAVLSKRTALFLVPLTALVLVEHAWRGYARRRSAPSIAGSPAPALVRRRVGAILAIGLLAVALVALCLWPITERASGWERAGAAWGTERSAAAARSGGYGLHVADRTPVLWQYLEQWLPATGGEAVTVVAWLRAARDPGAPSDVGNPGGAGDRGETGDPGATSAPGAHAQLVLNDDRAAWAGATIQLTRDWTPVTATLRISPGASRLRVALVPGEGTAAGMGAFDADDVVIYATASPGARSASSGTSTASLSLAATRLRNGGAEAPRRWGTDLAAGVARYTDMARVLDSVPGGLADPAASLDRTARGLAFTWRSFWGGFGWLAIWPGPVYALAAGLLTAFAAVAAATALAAPARLADDPVSADSLRLCAIAAALCLGIAVAGSLAATGPHRLPQGRYLLPALLALALPAVALAERWWPRWGPAALAALALGLDLAALLGVIWPAFRGAP